MVSGEDADDVRGLEAAHGRGDVCFEANGELKGFEAGFAGGGELLVKVEMGGGEELPGDVELDPAGGLKVGIFVVAEEGLFAGVGVFDDVPAVAGELGFVDDEGADGSHAGSLLKFVGPATVVGEGFAAEETGVVGGWVANDADNDFALHVDTSVIIPVEFGSGDAVADEDERGVDVDR